ncbi:hypothetical protein [Parabacteroides sp. PF5-9]|uniref:hypothetical protein n=1 Tax=Parabacteroides sp. PF5-9 TaxID=1742404 RepID=UPI002475F7DC|nr:hypothetical protein [Parabacteroides sp. PF5-9]MDH6357994.1 hypothetical protein [Parabacteroides sp. PF5-9]
MLKINKVVIISILIFTQLSLHAQNNTNSPYTRFGYGELADRSFGAGRAMGGVGIGLRSSKQINPMNPASYTSMDSLTFLFDFGAAGQVSWFDDGANSRKNVNGNFEYVAMQFPITRWMAMSIGMLPYSYVGYKFGDQITNGDLSYTENFVGSGGLNEVYAGLSIDIWKKRLSVGANVGYFFGNITHEQNVIFPSSSVANNVYKKERIEVRDIKLDFGVQYTHPISARERFTLGLIYSPSNKLNTTSYSIESVGSTSNAESDTITGQRFDIPHSYGAGISYTKENKLTLAADFLYEDWSSATFFDKKDNFKNRMRVAAGAEYIPEYMNRAYFSRVRYRVGAHYSNSYQEITMKEGNMYNPYGYKEYGASLGFGLPLIDNRSLLNISFEYVKVRPELKSMIDEQYFRFTVNYTFNEFWFFKRKID